MCSEHQKTANECHDGTHDSRERGQISGERTACARFCWSCWAGRSSSSGTRRASARGGCSCSRRICLRSGRGCSGVSYDQHGHSVEKTEEKTRTSWGHDLEGLWGSENVGHVAWVNEIDNKAYTNEWETRTEFGIYSMLTTGDDQCDICYMQILLFHVKNLWYASCFLIVLSLCSGLDMDLTCLNERLLLFRAVDTWES